MQDTAQTKAAANDFSLHYFLRPDHRDVADLWLASGGHTARNIASDDGRDWLFLHMENLHRQGAQTTCAFNRRTGGLAGFVTIDPDKGTLDQIIVASSDRGSGVAALLMEEAKRLADGPVTAHISEDNPQAIRFCEREGFSKTGTTASTADGARLWSMFWSPSQED